MEQQPRRACERTKSKQKQSQVRLHSNWKRVLLFDLAHKQCSSIIKGWLHCLTSESIGRFLTNNNILMFDSAWCLFIAQIQLSLIKKIKIGCPKYSLPFPPPPPRTPDNISFLPSPPSPPPYSNPFSQSGRHMCITPYVYIRFLGLWKGFLIKGMEWFNFESNQFKSVYILKL